MTTDTNYPRQDQQRTKVIYRGASLSANLWIGLIGAWVYYLGTAGTFWMGVLGFFKGIVWPAMLVYEMMKYLNM
jgi:hypothetical protein